VIRVAVVDDEAMARKRLVRLASEVDGVEVTAAFGDGAALVARAAEFDVVLLDIELGGTSGLDVLRALGDAGPRVIFVTAHAEHALAAFDAGAIDYVLKPVDAPRLEKALSRVRQRHEAREQAAPKAGSDAAAALPDRVAVPTRRGLLVLAPEELHYALVDGESLILHTARGVLVTDFRIAALERRLPPGRFVRAHRRVLLNVDHVLALEPVGVSAFVAELRDGAKVPVSRQVGRRLRARWTVGGGPAEP
jgi:two-component system LytT family response regulator